MCFWVRRCLEMPAFSLLATYISLLFHAVSLKYLFREKYGLVIKRRSEVMVTGLAFPGKDFRKTSLLCQAKWNES